MQKIVLIWVIMVRSAIAFIKKYPLVAVLLLGALFRIIYLIEYYHDPQWPQLLVDSLFHDRWAKRIAGGDVLGSEPFFRAPLYIYILGLIYWLTENSLLAARIFGHAVGLLGVAATYLIARRLFNTRTAVLAAIFHALYPIAMYFESELLVDSFFTTLLEYSVLLFLISIERKSLKSLFWCGIVLGLAAIARPLVLGLIPVFFVWHYFERDNIRQFSKKGAILALGIIIPILPVTLRNVTVGHDFVLIASSGGINFHIGNNDYADGYSASLPPPYLNTWEIKDIKYLAEKETGKELKPSEISSYFFGKGLNWIKENPLRFLVLTLKKWKFIFNNLEISNNRNLNYFFGTIGILKIIPLDFAIISGLAAMGIFSLLYSGGKYGRRAWFIPILILMYALLISLFFINARFRLPMLPLMMVFSAFGGMSIAEAAIRPSFNLKNTLTVAAGVVFLIIALLPISEVNKDDIKSSLFNRANYSLSTGEYDRAIEIYQELLRQNPGYPDANLNLGVAFIRKGNPDTAERYFREELRHFPDRARAYSNLASVYYLKKDYDSALALADRALEFRPYLSDPYLIKLRANHNMGDIAAITRTISTAERFLDNKGALYLEAGNIYSSFEMYDRAKEYLLSAYKEKPAAAEIDDNAFRQSSDGEKQLQRIRARAAYQLGFIYGITGKTQESIEYSRSAIGLDSTIVEAYINLINAYNEFGKPDSALIILALAENRFPDNPILAGFKLEIEKKRQPLY